MTQATRTVLRNRADKLFRDRVRARGGCEAEDWHIKCAGVLQCCHVVSRRYLSVRWDEDNAKCMCQAHHVYFTHRPLEWEDFCEVMVENYADLKRRAKLGFGTPDYDAILERLSA